MQLIHLTIKACLIFILFTLVLMGLLLGLSKNAFATFGNLEFSGGIDYSVGDYGQQEDTSILYLPLTVKTRLHRWTHGITIPYLRMSGPDTGAATPEGVTTISKDSTHIRTESGLGDIILSTQYSFDAIPNTGTYIDLIAKMKLATADKEKGLGTGANSYTLMLDVYQPGQLLDVIASAGYRINDSTTDFPLQNNRLASIGVTRQLATRLHGGLSYDYRSASSRFGTSSKEIAPYLAWDLTRNWQLKGYATLGLSDQSPDIGTGIQIRYRHR